MTATDAQRKMDVICCRAIMGGDWRIKPEEIDSGGSSGFRRTSGKHLYELHERELIAEILFGSSRLYEFFGFAMTDVHGLRSQDGWNFLFFGNIPRTDLGLSREGQPGDIDILIVPYRDGCLHVGKAAAIEVKRLSLTGPRWDKSTGRYGITQAKGLLAAGFPYVGILHLVVHAEGPAGNHMETLTARVVGENGEAVLGEKHVTDSTGWRASERQLGRLLAQGVDPVVGLNCVSLTELTHEGSAGIMVSVPAGRAAKLNPQATKECLINISQFVRAMAGDVTRRSIDRESKV